MLSVGISLFLLSEKTDLYFSWTINPPITASFLGAGYLASFLLEFLSARERIWARARLAVPGVWAFTLLTLVVTLLHYDRFHFDSQYFITIAGTWVWLIIYITVPIAMGILWFIQVQQPGSDPQSAVPLSGWVRTTLNLQGGFLLLLGFAMLVFPEMVIPHWPWTLSALTARAIGAWAVGIGIIALHASRENDWQRLYPMMISYTLFAILQLVNLIRYPAVLDWSRFSVSFYTIFMVSILLAGAYGTWTSKRAKLF